jgi:hypothetical protein
MPDDEDKLAETHEPSKSDAKDKTSDICDFTPGLNLHDFETPEVPEPVTTTSGTTVAVSNKHPYDSETPQPTAIMLAMSYNHPHNSNNPQGPQPTAAVSLNHLHDSNNPQGPQPTAAVSRTYEPMQPQCVSATPPA